MRNSIGNFIFGVPLKIQKNVKLLSANPFLNGEFAPEAAAKTLLFGHRAAARMRNSIGNFIFGVPLKIEKASNY